MHRKHLNKKTEGAKKTGFTSVSKTYYSSDSDTKITQELELIRYWK